MLYFHFCIAILVYRNKTNGKSRTWILFRLLEFDLLVCEYFSDCNRDWACCPKLPRHLTVDSDGIICYRSPMADALLLAKTFPRARLLCYNDLWDTCWHFKLLPDVPHVRCDVRKCSLRFKQDGTSWPKWRSKWTNLCWGIQRAIYRLFLQLIFVRSGWFRQG